MAAYTQREVITRRIEFALLRPANGVEVAKALQAARDAYVVRHRTQDIYDDSIWLDATDEEIVISFTAPAEKPPTS